MLKFDRPAVVVTQQHLDDAAQILIEVGQARMSEVQYTNSPTLNMAFNQHISIFSGQMGGLHQVIGKIFKDAQWLSQCFAIQASTFQGQEEVNQIFIEQVYDAGYNGLGWSAIKNMPVRNLDPIANVDYLTPAGVAEATVPLSVLIGMFSTDDSSALNLAARWRSAADQLEMAVGQLHSAAGVLAANTMGVSFDRAREAIEDISRVGTVVATNARVMEQSMLQFPVVRAQNLASLQAIEASTMGITEPAARVAAQQAAVVSFVTGTLQPSLELVRPPVVNLGVPVDGHAGGGVLSVGGDSVAAPRVRIDGVAGVAEQASTVARQGVSPVGESVAQPAAERVTAERVGVDPAAVRPVVGEQPPVNSTGVNAAGVNSAGARSVVQPAGMGSPAAPMPYTSTAQPNVAGGAIPTGAMAQSAQGGTRSATGANRSYGNVVGNRRLGAPATHGVSAGRVADAHSKARLPQLPYSAQEAQRQAAVAKNALNSTHSMGSVGGNTNTNGAPAGSNSHNSFAGQHSQRTGGHAGGMFGAGSRAGQQGKNTTTPKLKATPAVRDYFLREFFGKGSKKRTVRKVIDRG